MALWRQLTPRPARAHEPHAPPTGTSPTKCEHYLDEADGRISWRDGLSPERGAPRRAARARQRDRRSRAGARRPAGRTSSTRCSPTCATPRVGCAAAPASPRVTCSRWRSGIGATTAIFSAVNPILFEPLPYPDARSHRDDLGRRRRRLAHEGTFGMYRELAERSRAFDAIAVSSRGSRRSIGPARAGAARRAASQRRLLPRARRAAGARAGLRAGRRPPERAERRRYSATRSGGGASAAIARSLAARSRSTTTRIRVIGVMPSGFENVLAPVGRAVGAAAVRRVAAAGGPRVGASPAHRRPAAARASASIRPRERSTTIARDPCR